MNKYLYWTPRILSIVFLLFLAMFSLDVFEPGLSASEVAVGLFMHNIPVFILLALLWISWKHEIVGAATFISAGLIYIAFVLNKALASQFEWYMLSWILTIAGPAFLIGALWLINWRKKMQVKK